MGRLAALLLLGWSLLLGSLLAGCNKGPNPYMNPGDKKGTPADRTGGAQKPSGDASAGTRSGGH